MTPTDPRIDQLLEQTRKLLEQQTAILERLATQEAREAREWPRMIQRGDDHEQRLRALERVAVALEPVPAKLDALDRKLDEVGPIDARVKALESQRLAARLDKLERAHAYYLGIAAAIGALAAFLASWVRSVLGLGG